MTLFDKPVILFVEDYDGVREPFSKLLRMEGFEVVEAADGGEATIALSGLKDSGKDVVVFLDVHLGISEDDGRRVAKLIKEVMPNAVIIAVCSESQPWADEEVLKPYTLDDLLEELRKVAAL